jgi:hypothetical protein
LYFAAIRNRHADRGAWMTAAHDTHGYTLAEIAATVGLQDTRSDPYCVGDENEYWLPAVPLRPVAGRSDSSLWDGSRIGQLSC